MSQTPEQALQTQIEIEIGRDPRVLVTRRNVGLYIAPAGNVTEALFVLRNAGWRGAAIQSIGTPGEADLQGIIGGQLCPCCGAPVHPKPYAIEVKSERGVQSDKQHNWQSNVWQRRGGLFVLAKPGVNVREALGI